MTSLQSETIIMNNQDTANDKLRKDEERFRHISSTISDISYSCVCNKDGRYSIDWMAGAVERVLGYSVKEIIDLNCWGKLVIDEDFNNFKKNVTELNPGSSGTCELRLQRKNGEIVWISSFAECVKGNGQPEQICIYGALVDITERKSIEEELRMSKDRLDLFFSQSLDGFFFMMLDEPIYWDDTIDKEKTLDYIFSHQRITKINDAMLLQYRAEHKQFIGLTPNDFFAHDIEYGRNIWKEFFDKGKLHIDTNERRFDNSQMWVEGDYICLYDTDKRITGHFGIQRDITERKNAEKELRKSEERFRTLIDNIGEGVAFINDKEIFVFVNPEAEKIFGVGEGELTGLSLNSYLSDENLRIIEKETQKRHTGKASVYEIEIVLKNGTKKDILVTATPNFEDDKFIGTFGIFRDNTERKQMEVALMESEERYRVFINSTDDMVFLKDEKLNYLLVNNHLSEFFDAEKCDVIGKSDFELISQSAAQNCLASDILALNSDSVVIVEEEFDNKKFSTHKFKVPFSNGKFGVGGTVRDVTERRNAENKLKKQAEDLKELNATKDKFFSIVSHDLRSPFHALLGFTQILAEELPTLTLEDIQKIAVSMRKSANNLFHLLENLLAWSQNQRGFIQNKPGKILLSANIEASTKLVKDIAEKKSISLTYNIPQDLSVMADVQMFESLMNNLVMNAVKFTPKGGKVTITAKIKTDDSVEISVKDTGIGMNKYLIDSLFILDERTNRKGTDGEYSTGLGLIICKDYLEKLGSKLHIESEEGKGSTFCFTLKR